MGMKGSENAGPDDLCWNLFFFFYLFLSHKHKLCGQFQSLVRLFLLHPEGQYESINIKIP